MLNIRALEGALSILLALNPGMRRRKRLSINVSVLVLTVRILKADLVSLLVLSLCVESLKHGLIDLLVLLLEDRDRLKQALIVWSRLQVRKGRIINEDKDELLCRFWYCIWADAPHED